jgi:hypothetical protein
VRRLALILLAGCGGSEAAADLTIAPAWDGALLDVRPAVRGHNTVWSRGGLGLWDESAGDVDADAWAAVAPIAPGALRFPGGTRGLRWHFAGTVGDARVPQCDTFRGDVDATRYGLDEMLDVAARVEAPVALVTPLAEGTPEEAAAMLAFASGGDGSIGTDRDGVDWGTASAWAARRTSPAADVLLVEIGNEPYLDLQVGPPTSCGRAGRFAQNTRWEGETPIPITAADYAAQLRLHADALRAVDPDVIVGAAAMSEYAADAPDDAATAVASNDAAACRRAMGSPRAKRAPSRGGNTRREPACENDPWNPRLAADAGDAIGAWVLHPYDFSAQDDRVLLAERTRTLAHGLAAIADRPVAVTEFGTFFDADTMLNAILTAEFVRVGVEEQWLTVMRHILIEDDPDEPFAQSAAVLGPDHAITPGGEVAALLAEHLRAQAAPIEPVADDLAALATISADDLAIVLIDRRTRATDPVRTVELALPDGAWRGVAIARSATGLTSRAITRDEVEVAGQGAVTVAVPPTSVTIVRLARE